MSRPIAMHQFGRNWVAWAAFAACCGLAACGGREHSAQGSQVVAKVNDKEITISQLNEALQSVDPQTLTPEITKQAIDSLIDQELLVQAALKNKLDRDPNTVAGFERARRQILAQTYAERMLYPKLPVSASEEEKYYKDNPALFENRKLYRLTAYTVKQADMTDVLKTDLDKAHSADQVRDVLQNHQIRFETQQMNSAAEELPMEKLPQFAKAEIGDLLIAQQGPDKVLLISIAGLEQKPLSFEHAKPMIEQYLIKTRNGQAIRDHLKNEKAAAAISYVGQFAKYDTTARK